jgi:DME family drug/metabolite transporter
VTADAHLHGRGLLLIFAAALLWSTGGLGIKALPEPALKVAFYRSAVAAVALFVILRPRGWRVSPGFLVGAASYAACLTTFVVATKLTTAANAIFLQYSGVVWVLLFSPLVLREPLGRRDVMAVTVALGGMALFFVGRLETGNTTGTLRALLSGLCFAVLILALRFERHGGAEAAVTWGNVVAAVALLPFVASDLTLSARSTVVLGLLGVFQIAVAYALFVAGLKQVTATQASLTGMAEPVANPIWVFLLLGEVPSTFAMLGGAVVLAAIGWRTLVAPATAPPALAPPD